MTNDKDYDLEEAISSYNRNILEMISLVNHFNGCVGSIKELPNDKKVYLEGKIILAERESKKWHERIKKHIEYFKKISQSDYRLKNNKNYSEPLSVLIKMHDEIEDLANQIYTLKEIIKEQKIVSPYGYEYHLFSVYKPEKFIIPWKFPLATFLVGLLVGYLVYR